MRNNILGLGFSGAVAEAEGGFDPGLVAPGGGSGAPAEGPSGAPGEGIGGLLPPKGGSPVGATDGILGTAGFGPRVGADAPRDGAMPGLVELLAGTGEGESAGGGAPGAGTAGDGGVGIALATGAGGGGVAPGTGATGAGLGAGEAGGETTPGAGGEGGA